MYRRNEIIYLLFNLLLCFYEINRSFFLQDCRYFFLLSFTHSKTKLRNYPARVTLDLGKIILRKPQRLGQANVGVGQANRKSRASSIMKLVGF